MVDGILRCRDSVGSEKCALLMVQQMDRSGRVHYGGAESPKVRPSGGFQLPSPKLVFQIVRLGGISVVMTIYTYGL